MEIKLKNIVSCLFPKKLGIMSTYGVIQLVWQEKYRYVVH